MFVPVVSATFTTLGAFVPLLFWPGIIGKFMSYLPIIVIVVMCASLLSALIFMPIIGAIIASTHVDPKAKEAADIVMYPDKFDVKKVGGVTGVYVRTLAAPAAPPAPDAGGRLRASSSRSLPPTSPTRPAPRPSRPPSPSSARSTWSRAATTRRSKSATISSRSSSEILQVQGIQDVIMTFGGGDAMHELGGTPPDTIGTFQLQLHALGTIASRPPRSSRTSATG